MNRLPVRDITGPVMAPRPRNRRPRRVNGRFTLLRMALGAGLLTLFFTLPWWQWRGEPAVWLNLANGRLNLFGASFWPEDLSLLASALIVAAFALFFVTVLAGRVWCGYACPQTLWAAMFVWCERLTGSGRKPHRFAQARRMVKHLLWLGISACTAFTLVALFVPGPRLVARLLAGDLEATTLCWLAAITLATYANAGWLREQLCIYLCPYARFQAVMFDRRTPVVSYQRERGDCVQCTLCVQVCPTGIDIRDGLQIGCIACGACADACDGVMARMNLAKGLVAYRGAEAPADGKGFTLRPRLLGYGAMLLASAAVLGHGLASRPLVSLAVSKGYPLYRDRGDGHIENLYNLTLMNKTQQPQVYHLTATGPAALGWRGKARWRLAPGERRTEVISLALPYALAANQPVAFEARAIAAPASTGLRVASRFTGPAR